MWLRRLLWFAGLVVVLLGIVLLFWLRGALLPPIRALPARGKRRGKPSAPAPTRHQ